MYRSLQSCNVVAKISHHQNNGSLYEPGHVFDLHFEVCFVKKGY